MFGWFRKASKNLRPESRWSVSLTEGQIVVTGPDGNASQVAEMDLSGIVIETNDSGPWGADVWWLLFGVDDLMACAYQIGRAHV